MILARQIIVRLDIGIVVLPLQIRVESGNFRKRGNGFHPFKGFQRNLLKRQNLRIIAVSEKCLHGINHQHQSTAAAESDHALFIPRRFPFAEFFIQYIVVAHHLHEIRYNCPFSWNGIIRQQTSCCFTVLKPGFHKTIR